MPELLLCSVTKYPAFFEDNDVILIKKNNPRFSNVGIRTMSGKRIEYAQISSFCTIRKKVAFKRDFKEITSELPDWNQDPLLNMH